MAPSNQLSESSVLIVEDEVIVAIEVADMMREMGFGSVEVAHNLRRAEKAANSLRPTIAILDVNLGAGERTTEFGLALSEAGTRIMFASGYNRSELDPQIQHFPFVEKPVSSSDLRSMVIRLIEGD